MRPMLTLQYASATRLILYPILLVYVASVGAQEIKGDTGFEIERFSWVGTVPVEAGQCDCNITVINRFGTVRARFGGYEGQVEVFANVQHFAEEEPRLTVETRESLAGVQVTVGYRDRDSEALVSVRNDQKKRADLVVWVPLGVPLSVSTDQGLIDMRGLRSDVQAQSDSGNITALKIQGNLNFNTFGGDILTLLEDWDRHYDHHFTTGSGEQKISFGGEVDTHVRVATSGLISTDFSMDVDYLADRQPVRKANVLIGKGSSTVTMSSASGHIRLVSIPLASKARVHPGTGK